MIRWVLEDLAALCVVALFVSAVAVLCFALGA